MISDITAGIQTVTASGPVTGTLDTSSLTGDFTVCVDVVSLTPASKAVICIEDTASPGAPFSDARQLFTVSPSGSISAVVVTSRRYYELGALRFGTSNSKLRLNVLALQGINASLRVTPT